MVTEDRDISDAERVGWARLKDRVLSRDGRRCRNCSSEKYLEVHHWLPLPHEREGIDRYGYSTGKQRLVVPESGLITLCQICHTSLTEARKIVRLSENSDILGEVSVPERDYHNLFELWILNGRQLPMKIVRESWSQSSDHYMLVERIEIRKWPYGFAWGSYYRGGTTEGVQKISSAGSYQWRKLD